MLQNTPNQHLLFFISFSYFIFFRIHTFPLPFLFPFLFQTFYFLPILSYPILSYHISYPIPREHTYWQYKCIAWMHCKSLWIKASAKCKCIQSYPILSCTILSYPFSNLSQSKPKGILLCLMKHNICDQSECEYLIQSCVAPPTSFYYGLVKGSTRFNKLVPNGAFPLHGTARYSTVRFTFGGFSTGYCTWYLILF